MPESSWLKKKINPKSSATELNVNEMELTTTKMYKPYENSESENLKKGSSLPKPEDDWHHQG